jgi:hypothetical protein
MANDTTTHDTRQRNRSETSNRLTRRVIKSEHRKWEKFKPTWSSPNTSDNFPFRSRIEPVIPAEAPIQNIRAQNSSLSEWIASNRRDVEWGWWRWWDEDLRRQGWGPWRPRPPSASPCPTALAPLRLDSGWSRWGRRRAGGAWDEEEEEGGASAKLREGESFGRTRRAPGPGARVLTVSWWQLQAEAVPVWMMG